MQEYTKYDIVFGNLNPRKGTVQSGIRPCVVVQSNSFNKYSSTILIVPLTSTIKDPFPSEFLINPSKENGLTSISRYLGSQIITIDKQYIHEKIGQLEEQYYKLVDESIKIVFDV